MYARVTTGQAKQDKVDELIRMIQDSIIPAARQQRGFKGVIALTALDRSGKWLAVTLWETEADIKASAGFRSEQLEKMRELFSAQPGPGEVFEVSAQTFLPEKSPVA